MNFIGRKFNKSDLDGVRAIYGEDEFARPRLLRKYPRMASYLADEASLYYTRYEPESLFVAEAEGKIVGALLGCVHTARHEKFYQRRVRPYLILSWLTGAYGSPFWAITVIRTELAGREVTPPRVDREQYPAHLHIGVLPSWRRQGIGMALMDRFTEYLRQKGVTGFHLYASSYHPMGMAFYRKLGLEELGQFDWRLHDGFEWRMVKETIFGKKLDE